MASPPSCEPDGEQSQRRSRAVEHHVTEASFARGNEILVDLVTGGIQGCDSEGEHRLRPPPGPSLCIVGMLNFRLRNSQRPPDKRGQNRILRHVSRFSDCEDDLAERDFRNVRNKPAHDWSNDSRSMARRHGAGGSGEDEAHPEDNWHPRLEKPGNAAHAVIRASAATVKQTKSAAVS